MMGRLRLLKVMVQPVFVVDDGEALAEQPGQTVEVPAAAWRAFGETSFNTEEMATLQEQYDAAQVDPLAATS